MRPDDDEFILGSTCHQKQPPREADSGQLGHYSAADNRQQIPEEKPKRKRYDSKLIDEQKIETVTTTTITNTEIGCDRLTGYILRGNVIDPIDNSVGSGCGRATHCFINMKCTDGGLATFSFFIGVAAILLQIMSLGSDNWLYTIEPRGVGNVSKGKDEPQEYLFQYNAGYWRICRERYVSPKENLTAAEVHFVSTEFEFRRVCLSWNRPPNGSDDHIGFSKASGAVINRILLSAILHIVSLAITGMGLGLAIPGHIRRDKRTFVAAILYIMSGICMSIAVMQYICVVDDEMAPKKKQTPEGDPSKYEFDYGWSYVAASMSFMCIETCALVELLLFLRRFPSLEDKMSLVPGLKDKIRRAVLHHEFDEILPARTCSRSSPRISFSYAADVDTVPETAFSDSL